MRELIVLSFLALCLTPEAIQAQTAPRADVLTGRVTDLTGKPIADAQVGATSLGSGLTRYYTTDMEGRYKIFFPETASQYVLQVKRMGFPPIRRTVTRHTKDPEHMTIDMQLGGAPLALSMVEINGGSDAPVAPESEKHSSIDSTVPNPVAEILELKDTLRLSAVQILALSDVADTLQSKNGRLYKSIRTLLAKSEAGDMTQMAGTIAMMLEEASGNTAQAVAAAEKLLRPEQWLLLPPVIKDHPGSSNHLHVPIR